MRLLLIKLIQETQEIPQGIILNSPVSRIEHGETNNKTWVEVTSGNTKYRPPVRKLNHYAKINFLTSVTIFYVSPWGKKHSEPINTIEIYLNCLFIYYFLQSGSV